MAGMVAPSYIVERCVTLKKNWTDRDKKFTEWYDILKLMDTLAQEGMESVATNDPRTGYNLAKHLLISMTIADKVPSEQLTPEQAVAVSYLESFVTKRWQDQERRYRTIGRQSWIGELFSWMLTLGWYSVFSMVTKDEIWAEVWSPAECYPEFGTEGLIEHARIYTLSAAAANRKVKVMGWKIGSSFTGPVDFYDHWTFDEDGSVVNAIVAGGEFVKEPVKDVYMSKLGKLPVFTSPIGGLPNMGGTRKSFGESIVATNEDLNLNYNKMRSFLQQAARTAAQPHWLELSSGETPIANEALMDRWGSVLHGQPGDSVTPLQTPQIPVELTNILYTYQNELQRGSFPYAVFGNIQQQMSYLAMANVASASLQVLTPYIEAYKGLRSDLDNFWSDMLLVNKLKPYKFDAPQNIPEGDMRMFDVDATVEIPGYLIQRATVARMMNPNFKLPKTWVMERIFPEIKNSLKATADIRAEEAMEDPRAIMVDQILAYLEQARMNRESDTPNIKAAELYEKLASVLEAGLTGQQAPQKTPAPEGQMAEQAVMREAFPTKETTPPVEGLGRV